MPNTSVGRVASLLPVLELLDDFEKVYAESEANFAALPHQLKTNLAGERNRSMLEELCVFLLTVSPDARRQHRQRLQDCAESLRTVVEEERGGGDSGVLFEPEDLSIVRRTLKALPFLRGRRNRRELDRFFDAIETNDVAYLVVKCDSGTNQPKLEARMAHHLPTEVTRLLKLDS